MKPLHTLVIVKNSAAALERENRSMGMWSYPVPEFTWDFRTPGKNFRLNRDSLKRQGYDFVFHEDGGNWGSYGKDGDCPVAYYAIDSTLSEENHYLPRRAQAQKADLVLVDHDQLERFTFVDKPTHRLLYCVNDHLFCDVGMGKDIDVNFNCGGNEERAALRAKLHELAKTDHYIYNSGTLPLIAYARSLSASRLVIILPRNTANRPHRLYDALMCHACVLTKPLPNVDPLTAGTHYYTWETEDDLFSKIGSLLKSGRWSTVAEQGFQQVHAHHTWAVRAQELRALVAKELGR